MKQCEYCRPVNNLPIRENSGGLITLYLGVYVNEIEYEVRTNEEGYISSSVEIFFCPMCGKKLGRNSV